MSFILGSVTLPQPKSFARKFIEVAQENLLIYGKTTKSTQKRKEMFTLVFQELTPAQANSILSEYRMEAVRVFQVTETNLTIAATDVLINIAPRKYLLDGGAYREYLTLILTEVT